MSEFLRWGFVCIILILIFFSLLWYVKTQRFSRCVLRPSSESNSIGWLLSVVVILVLESNCCCCCCCCWGGVKSQGVFMKALWFKNHSDISSTSGEPSSHTLVVFFIARIDSCGLVACLHHVSQGCLRWIPGSQHSWHTC